MIIGLIMKKRGPKLKYPDLINNHFNQIIEMVESDYTIKEAVEHFKMSSASFYRNLTTNQKARLDMARVSKATNAKFY